MLGRHPKRFHLILAASLITVLFCPCGYAKVKLGETRVFTSTDGRQVEATVTLFNPHNEIATLKINGRSHDIPLSRFIEEDQAYLIAWRDEYQKSFVRVDFFTLRIKSGRILYMLDSSGSMSGDRWNKMVKNMAHVIDNMDDNADFNIILFGSDAKAFKDSLVPATEVEKFNAIAWLRNQGPGGGTDLLAAVKLAATMQTADAYAILSDGYPADANEIPEAIRRNEAKHGSPIRVYTVSYYSSNEGIDFLKDLAAKFDGAFARR